VAEKKKKKKKKKKRRNWEKTKMWDRGKKLRFPDGGKKRPKKIGPLATPFKGSGEMDAKGPEKENQNDGFPNTPQVLIPRVSPTVRTRHRL